MQDTLPPIYFYVPSKDWPADISKNTGYFWSANRAGKHNWTIQTYHHLKSDGFPCEIVQHIPSEGIILGHRTGLRKDLKPGPKQLLVCIQADRGRHPYAQIHLIQNKLGTQISDRSLRDRVGRILIPFPKQSCFIRQWPQPELIPREPKHSDRFQNIAYMGRARNLAPELRDRRWFKRLTSLGFRCRIVEEREQWKDYRNVHAVIAVRSFDGKKYTHKPATKLYNAWHAGVPAILGPESAFQAERKSDLDYIEVASLEDVIEALQRFRDEKALYRTMVENGRMRAKETQTEKLVSAWREFLTEIAVPAHHLWCSKSGLARASFTAFRHLMLQGSNLAFKVRKYA